MAVKITSEMKKAMDFAAKPPKKPKPRPERFTWKKGDVVDLS